jgi:hypothetical protein
VAGHPKDRQKQDCSEPSMTCNEFMIWGNIINLHFLNITIAWL